jgi:tol-pal system protein YbgF
MKRFVSCLLLTAVLPAVAYAASGATMEQRLEKLERRVGTVTDLTLRLDAMQRENRQLRGEIETLQYQIEKLKRKQRDIYLDIDQRLSNLQSAPGAAAPVPAVPAPKGPVADAPAPITDLARPAEQQPKAPQPVQASVPATAADPQKMQSDYKAAYALLSPGQRRYADAAKAFTVFLENYPGSPLAPNAQYWLAEAYYVSQKNEQALSAFRKVVNDHPGSPKVPGALYKIGRLEHVRGNNDAARKALERVVAEYPTAPAAGLAKELLAKIGG